jgi:putative membrane protein
VIARLLVGFVALEHIAFLALEMFLWEKPLGLKVFGQTPEAARLSAVLAKNQGLYNGFLAAGLIWGLVAAPPVGGPVKTFFLGCVVVAGAYGAFSTGKTSLFFVQSLPALLALAALKRN